MFAAQDSQDAAPIRAVCQPVPIFGPNALRFSNILPAFIIGFSPNYDFTNSFYIPF
jgi:hypothetical protein